MPIVNPGEIWKINIPDTQGHEQRGNRPALVVAVHPTAYVTMVIPFTKNQDYLRFPNSHKVVRSVSNGLLLDSVALIFQMRCLTNSDHRFLSKYGIIEQNQFSYIKLLIKNYLRI